MFVQKMVIPAVLLSAVLAGCASLPPDVGRGDVTKMLKERGREVPAASDAAGVQSLLNELANRPLTASDAVHLALINNPKLKAEYAKLGLAAADVYDAGRLSNPSFSAAVMFPNASGAANQVGLGLVQSFTDMILLPARSRLAKGEFERAKQLVGAEALNAAADAEIAYYRLAGAGQMVAMQNSIAEAAQSSAELAQRYFDAGNINRLELNLEQATASMARLNVLKAQADVVQARADLNRMMGLGVNEARWKISAGLPAPLENEDTVEDLFKVADAHRLDLVAARKRVDLLADALGVARRTRFLGEFAIGVETQRETDGSRLTGPTFSLELPIFNQGSGRTARAQANLQSAEAELHAMEIDISNGIQRAAADVATAKLRIEQYRQSLIPLRESIVARTQELLNFMFASAFDLIMAKQQEYDAYQGYLEAVQDYWLARSELARAVGAPLPSNAQMGKTTLDADVLIKPKQESQGMGHAQHGGMKMDGMNEMEGMDHSGHDMKDMPGMDHKAPPAAKPARKSAKSSGTHAKKNAAPNMGTHQDGKDMPEHGKAKQQTQDPHAGMNGMQHDMGDMKDMQMPDESSTKTQHGDHP